MPARLGAGSLPDAAYCAVVVVAAEGDVVATFGSMTSVSDRAESGARTMTVLVEVAIRR